MKVPDAGFVCPKCGQPLMYLLSIEDVHIYRCVRDGLIVLPPDGILRQETAAEVEARIDRKASTLS